MNRLFSTELFDMLSYFINDDDELLVSKVEMSSPGGFTFVRRIKRFPDSKRDQDPLIRTINFVNAIVEGKPITQRELIVQNKSVDPRLLELINRTMYDGPTQIIYDLAYLKKIDHHELEPGYTNRG
jgi:hypothetical protein